MFILKLFLEFLHLLLGLLTRVSQLLIVVFPQTLLLLPDMKTPRKNLSKFDGKNSLLLMEQLLFLWVSETVH